MKTTGHSHCLHQAIWLTSWLGKTPSSSPCYPPPIQGLRLQLFGAEDAPRPGINAKGPLETNRRCGYPFPYIDHCNHRMNRVDIGDQYRSAFSVPHRRFRRGAWQALFWDYLFGKTPSARPLALRQIASARPVCRIVEASSPIHAVVIVVDVGWNGQPHRRFLSEGALALVPGPGASSAADS